MERMIKDKQLRANIIKQSSVLAETIFNIKTINKEIENLYNELSK